MTDEPNTASPAETEKQHPLLAAFHDMKRVAVTQRGLKILARIQFGIENRERWIENRQSQINRLHKLSADALEAYDRGDDEDMKQVLREVEGIVGMSEGVSAAEIAMAEAEILEDEQESEGPFPPTEKLPFKGNRRKDTGYSR